MCAEFHLNRKNSTVRGLARKNVVKATSTNFRRCSTYSASDDRSSSQVELKKMKLCMYLIKKFHNVCAKNHPNPTFLRVKGLARKKWLNEKAQISRDARFFCFRWQNIESREAKEVEALHIVSQLLPLCVCQISTKLNKFLAKRASEEKIGPTKNHKLQEMLDLLCFRWQNFMSSGDYKNETLHVVSQLFLLCVYQTSSKSNKL